MNAAKRVRHIVKAEGHREPFNRKKLYLSLRAAGAGKETAERVLREISPDVRSEMTTRQLTQLVTRSLTKVSRPLAARYRLKVAILELGPTGYPFERLVAEILKAQGFRTQVGQTLEGECVHHEVDVIARGDTKDLVECKFRNNPGDRCDVKVTLYVYARSLDLKNGADFPNFDRFRLITNTKFTGDAIRYAECVGLHLLGWDYPKPNALPQVIEELGLHPLTCLTTLNVSHKRALVRQGYTLCRELEAHPQSLESLGLQPKRLERVYSEVAALRATHPPSTDISER